AYLRADCPRDPRGQTILDAGFRHFFGQAAAGAPRLQPAHQPPYEDPSRPHGGVSSRAKPEERFMTQGRWDLSGPAAAHIHHDPDGLDFHDVATAVNDSGTLISATP